MGIFEIGNGTLCFLGTFLMLFSRDVWESTRIAKWISFVTTGITINKRKITCLSTIPWYFKNFAQIQSPPFWFSCSQWNFYSTIPAFRRTKNLKEMVAHLKAKVNDVLDTDLGCLTRGKKYCLCQNYSSNSPFSEAHLQFPTKKSNAFQNSLFILLLISNAMFNIRVPHSLN